MAKIVSLIIDFVDQIHVGMMVRADGEMKEITQSLLL
jgi:hypothetical protein